MSTYFKIVGVLNLICTIFAAIIMFIFFMPFWIKGTGVVTNKVFLDIFIFVLFIFFAPAISLVFLAVSDIIKQKSKKPALDPNDETSKKRVSIILGGHLSSDEEKKEQLTTNYKLGKITKYDYDEAMEKLNGHS